MSSLSICYVMNQRRASSTHPNFLHTKISLLFIVRIFSAHKQRSLYANMRSKYCRSSRIYAKTFHYRLTILLDDFSSEMRNDLLKRVAIDVNK